jgi:hypothetical protein
MGVHAQCNFKTISRLNRQVCDVISWRADGEGRAVFLHCKMSFLALSDAPPQDGRASLSAQSGNGAIITPIRRFPPPWLVEEHNNAWFIVRDATRQAR